MTAEDILMRKRELLDARRRETDRFSRFFLDEELADLNARLRSLRRAPRARHGTNSPLALERGQYLDWLASARDDETDAAHQAYRDALGNSAEVLTARQRELFDAWRSGAPASALAERFGVDKSTVSRTLARCKKRLRAEAAARSRALRLDGAALDLADAETARLVLSCLTAHQAVCVYLYYGEQLNLRECGELLGVGHTAVLRTLQRALRAIGDTLRCEIFTLDNADALSDLAYALYVEAGMPDELPPEQPKPAWARRKLGYAPTRPRPTAAAYALRAPDGPGDRRAAARRAPERPMSRLLALLYELRRKGPLRRWLERLFEKITRKRREDER